MSGNLLWLRRQLLENLSILGYTHYTFPVRPLFSLVFGLFSHPPPGDEAVWKHIYKIIWRKYFFSRALLDESFYFIFLGPSLRSSSCLVLPITSNLSANSFLCCAWISSGETLMMGSWKVRKHIFSLFIFFFAQSCADCERGAGEWQAITWNSEILIRRSRLSHYTRDFTMKMGKSREFGEKKA